MTHASLTTSQPLLTRLAERVRGLVASSLLRSSALSVFDQALLSGTNFLTAVIIGRACSNGELGVYYLVLTGLFLLLGVQEQLISAPYSVFLKQRESDKASFAGSTLIHQFAIVLLVTVLMGTSLACFPTIVSSTIGVGLASMLIWTIPFLLLRGFVREFLFANLKLRTLFVMDFATCSVQLIGLWCLLSADSLNATTVYLLMGIACGMAATTWLFLNRKCFDFTGNWLADWLSNWQFSRWALATHVVGSSTPYVMPWVLFSIHGDAATGLMASCSAVVGLSNMVLSGIANFLTPRAARSFADEGVDGLKSLLRRINLLFVIVLGGISVLAAVGGEQLIDFVYDGKFANTGPIVFTLSLAVLSNSMGVTAGNGLWAINRPRANLVADCVTFIAAVVAAFAFIPVFGALGAALAILTANTLGAGVRVCVLRSALKSLSL